MSDITEPIIEDATVCETLLPKLISDELHVKAAEPYVAEAAP